MIFALTVSSFASSYSGYITRIYTRPDKNLILLSVEGYNDAVISQPACNTNTSFQYAFDPTTPAGMVTLSTVLAALNSELPVSIKGSGICSVYSSIENLLLLNVSKR
ncbi:MAG: hypothetical protein AB7E76_04365 [Deferribacterales bacterium]